MMTERIQTRQFGAIEYQEQDVVRFPKPLPGFEKLERFVLVDSQDFQPFKFLQSLDQPPIAFPLLDPKLVAPDFCCAVAGEEKERVGLNSESEALVYCMVTLPSDPRQASVNLFAPVIINTSRMLGTQIILFESDYPVAKPLWEEE